LDAFMRFPLTLFGRQSVPIERKKAAPRGAARSLVSRIVLPIMWAGTMVAHITEQPRLSVSRSTDWRIGHMTQSADVEFIAENGGGPWVRLRRRAD
jgi:hypothetical protein